MLKDKNPVATVAVKDIKAARSFYENTLGLTLVHNEGEEAFSYRAGAAEILVYRSQFAGTNRATAVTWIVGPDIENLVRGLKSKGVVFEKYDMPGMKEEGGIYSAGGLKNAWFKDPDGNIHALVSA
jgi:catechol 2,3-dioxygenase-like lactoylglutathione lyase family enzyme